MQCWKISQRALKILQWLLINSNKILFQELIFINICAKLFDTFRFCIMNYNDDQKLNANPNLVSFYHYHTENSILIQRLKWATFSPHYSLNLRKFILNHSYQLAPWHNALGTHSKKKNYENSEHGPICGRGGSCISLKKYIFL